jgi:FMN phosphatase YigB (HAD superfamily)
MIATGTTLIRAVTIDFHDTLFHCDRWFELEVRDLPALFFEWLASELPEFVVPDDELEVRRVYRQLRTRAIEDGIEVDSIDGVDQVCRAFDLHVDRRTIVYGVDILMRETLPSAMPFAGSIELVRSLRSAGLKLGVISNAIHHPFLEWALERFNFLNDFDMVLSSADAGYYKSRVELYQLAAERLGVRANEIVHIGDSYRFDVVGAAGAGMHTVWLNLTGDAARDVVPDLTVDSLVGLMPHLRNRFDLQSEVHMEPVVED